MIYSFGFATEAPIRRFYLQRLDVNLKTAQMIRKSWISPIIITKVQQLGNLTPFRIEMPPFIFQHGPRLNTETYIKCPEEVVLTWIKRMTDGIPYALQQASEPCQVSRRIGYVNMSVIISPLRSGLLNAKITIPLITKCVVWLSEKPTKL